MEIHDIYTYKGEFFRIIEETEKSQTGVMTIPKGSDSGAYGLHQGDQFIHCIEGEGQIEVDGKRHDLVPGSTFTIPAGVEHKAYASAQSDLFFVTVYAPPVY